MVRTRLRVLLASAALLGAAACGDDDTTVTSPGDGGTEENGVEDAQPSEELRGSGRAGTVRVDGIEYLIDEVRLCDVTDFFAGDNRTIEWRVEGTGLADPDRELSEETRVAVSIGESVRGGGDRAYHREMHSLYWRGPDGIIDMEALREERGWQLAIGGPGSELDGPPLEITEDRITGSITERDGTEISVDLAQPSGGPVDC